MKNTTLLSGMPAGKSRKQTVNQQLSSFTGIRIVLLMLFFSFIGMQVWATTYYSWTNSAPNNKNNWFKNADGTGTHPANFTSGDIFIIQNGNTMTTTANWNVSGNGAGIQVNGSCSLIGANNISSPKLTINVAGNCTINNNKTLSITNGTSPVDLLVQGTVTNAGTISLAGGAVASFESGSKYTHNQNGGTIPTASWNAASTCEVTGCLNTVPSGLSQSFGNFTWNSPQTSAIQLNGSLSIITGNFTVQNTGSNQLRLTNTKKLNMTIGGDFILSNGTVNFSNGAAAVKVLNLGGNFSQSGGTFTNSNSTVLSFNFTGTGKTFSLAGILTNTYINWSIISGASLSLASNLPVAATRTCTVNGSLNCSTFSVNGTGSFALTSGGTLQMGSPDGISASAAVGNILVTGGRSYSTGANYIYSAGSGNPVTGDGLPATINNLIVSTTSGNPLSLSGNTLTVSGNMTVSSGGKLQLGSSKQLTVSGTTSLSGTDCLVLKSDAGGTASFINSGAISGTYNAKVERYIANNWDWHFLSSPVSSQDMWPEFVPAPTGSSYSNYNWGTGPWNWDMYYFNANCLLSGLYWVNMRLSNGYYNYNPVDAPGNFAGFGTTVPTKFSIARGYQVAYTSGWNPPKGSPETHVFSGTLNEGTISKPITYTATSWNLVGNPYPSALDFNLLYAANSANLAYDSYYVMLGDGTYASYSVASGGTAGASRYIAPMQGFMVVASANASLSFTNGMRVHNSQSWLKKSETFTNHLSLKVTNEVNNLSDEILVHFNPEFNSEGGALKMFSFAKEAPNLYTINGTDKFTINQLPSIDSNPEIPLCLVPGITARYTLEATGTETFDPGTSLLLTDLVTGAITDLGINPVYSFTASPSDIPNRFVIRFGRVAGLGNPESRANFNISATNHLLTIENNSAKGDYQVLVYDIHGRQQLQQSASGQLINIGVNFAPGMYVVRIISGDGTSTAKIIIR